MDLHVENTPSPEKDNETFKAGLLIGLMLGVIGTLVAVSLSLAVAANAG